MKNFLRGGRGMLFRLQHKAYGLQLIFCVLFSKVFRFQSLIGAKGFLAIVLVALSFQGVQAQQIKPNENSLYIGDTVPESFWTEKHKFLDSKTFKLSEEDLSKYKDKLVIFDFWYPGCAPCLESLRKLKEQKLSNPDVDFYVVPVTYQMPIDSKLDILKIRIKQQEFLFNSIVGDSTIHSLFPHRGSPHMVWVYKGKVIAKPKWDYATAANFRTILSGKEVKVYNQLTDLAINPEDAFFTPSNGDTEVLHDKDGVQIARYIPNIQFEEPKIVRINDRTIFFAINMNLEMMLYEAFKEEIFPKLDWQEGFGLTWVLSERKRSTLFKERVKLGLYKGLEEDLKYDAWAKNNMYCFAVTMNGNVSDKEIRKQFQKELNNWLQRDLGLYAEIQNHKVVEYAVLHSTNQQKSIQSFGKPIPKNRPQENGVLYATYHHFYDAILSKLYDLTDKPLLWGMLIDSTGIAADQGGAIWLPRTKHMSLSDLQALLNRYHLYLTFEYEKVPSLLIQEVLSPYK